MAVKKTIIRDFDGIEDITVHAKMGKQTIDVPYELWQKLTEKIASLNTEDYDGNFIHRFDFQQMAFEICRDIRFYSVFAEWFTIAENFLKAWHELRRHRYNNRPHYYTEQGREIWYVDHLKNREPNHVYDNGKLLLF